MATSQFTESQDVSDTTERWQDSGHGFFQIWREFCCGPHTTHVTITDDTRHCCSKLKTAQQERWPGNMTSGVLLSCTIWN